MTSILSPELAPVRVRAGTTSICKNLCFFAVINRQRLFAKPTGILLIENQEVILIILFGEFRGVLMERTKIVSVLPYSVEMLERRIRETIFLIFRLGAFTVS